MCVSVCVCLPTAATTRLADSQPTVARRAGIHVARARRDAACVPLRGGGVAALCSACARRACSARRGGAMVRETERARKRKGWGENEGKEGKVRDNHRERERERRTHAPTLLDTRAVSAIA